MRLTLRTLLSYLDGVHLSDEEREAIRQQIDASENASEWIHRTRDVMRRLKLGTPDLDGAGSADDPNSVAEYLDRTLPDVSVAEFERVCLESDVQLAEVAACHHVLAMFLSEQSEIDPDTRNRLHRLQADLTEATQSRKEPTGTTPVIEPPVPAPPVESPAPVEPGPVAPPRRRRQATKDDAGSHVPSYLREQQWKQWAPAAAALVLLSVTAGIAFMPGGPLNRSVPAEVAESTTPEDPTPAPLPAEVGTETDEAELLPAETTETEMPPEPPVEPDGEEAVEPPPAVEEPEDTESDLGDSMDEPLDEESPEPLDAEPLEIEVAEPPVVAYTSDRESLAAYELMPGSWRRLETGFPIAGPTRVVSLPNYRGEFSLGETLRAELVGLTDAKLGPPADAESPFRLELAHGRVLLTRAVAAEGPGEVQVVLDGQTQLVSLEPGAILAIRADRPFQPGWPIENSSPPLVAVADTLAGAVTWNRGGASERVTMGNGKRLTGEDTESLIPTLGGNEWVERLPISAVIEDAAIAIAGGDRVNTGAPLWPQLRTIAGEDQFEEYRMLAAAASLALNHPDTLVESFKDDDNRVWARNLAWLRQSASRSPSAAETIHRVFQEKTSSGVSDELMQLLIGFTREEIGLDPDSLAQGSVQDTILPALESPEFAIRVLGSLVLDESVDGADGMFKPDSSERRREGQVRAIRVRLNDGRLTPKAP